jgi:SAM-dependent methyltransferase
MKLSELVEYLNLLDSEPMIPNYNQAARQMASIEHVIANHAVQIETWSTNYVTHVDAIKCSFDNALGAWHKLRSALLLQISDMEQQMYQRSLQIYQEEMSQDTTEYILNRQMLIDHDSKQKILGRLQQLANWKWPGMIIHPGKEKFIEHLVSLDPLYLVDTSLDLLQPAVQDFTKEYQQRLRLYQINDYENQQPLWQLPRNQFGLIFIYNFFNYRPQPVLARYFADLYELLRPGGSVIFTYNNCDWAHGVALAESGYMCYTPGRQIRSLLNDLQFKIIDEYRGLENLFWMEIQKPGEIQSIKGGQSLAKIIAT